MPKLSKKERIEAETLRAQAILMLPFGETQLLKARADGGAAAIRNAIAYLLKVNQTIDECNAKLH